MRRNTLEREMSKVELEPTTLIFPMTCAVISCPDPKREASMLAVAYVAMVNAKPPMLAVSISPSSHSYALIKKAGEFVVNIPLAQQAWSVDLAGSVSGKNVDKFDLVGLTQQPSVKVNCPAIAEFPINIECKLLDRVQLPTHDLFIAQVVAVYADQSLLEAENQLASTAAPFLILWNRNYFEIGNRVGFMGFSKKVPQPPPAD